MDTISALLRFVSNSLDAFLDSGNYSQISVQFYSTYMGVFCHSGKYIKVLPFRQVAWYVFCLPKNEIFCYIFLL